MAVDCQEGETLLQAGLRQGVPLPYGCGAGVCSTCVARARPGTVENAWAEAPGAENLKRDKGECLLCQSLVTDDCEILVPGKIDLAQTLAETPAHHCARLHDVALVAPDVATFQLSLEGQAGQECIKGLIHQTGSASRNFYLNEPVLPLEGEVPAEMTAVAWYLRPAHR